MDKIGKYVYLDNIEYNDESQLIILPGAECSLFDYLRITHEEFLLNITKN